ncbi:MAG: BspA family leucine-rich repeat surface protein [Lactobacillus crispatus]
MQLSEKTQSTTSSTTPDKAPTQEGNYNVNDWEGSIDSETHEYTLNKYNGSDKANIYIPNTYDFLKAGKIGDNDKVYIDEGLINRIVNNGAVTITVDSTGDSDKNKVYAKGSNWDLAFARSNKLKEVDLSHLDTSEITSAQWMFGDDTALTYANVANWSFNNNANLAGLFGGSTGDYNLQRVDMSNMDLSKVSCLNQIFQNDKSLTIVDFRKTTFADKATTAWMFSGPDTSKINIQLSGAKNIPKDVFDTFKNAAKTQKVDKIDLSNASLSSEVTGSGLLSGLSDVKQIDVTNFDISHVTDMTNMFSGDTNLTKIIGLSTWNVGNVTSMNSMFAGDTALTNLDSSNWKPLKVTNMAAMFKGCSGLKSITLNWGQNTKNVQNFSEMFSSDKNLTEINGLSDWDVSNATDFRWMFTNDTSLTEINGLSGWDVSNATQLSNMFSGDSSLKSMDLSNWKTSKVTDLSNLFNGDTALQTVNMSNMDLRNVNNFNLMFSGATSLSKIDFRNTRFLDSDKIQSSYFNSTNPIVELSGAQKVPKFLFDMLKSSKAKTIDLRNTSLASNITDLSTAFYNDQAVEEIDMTGFDISHITNMSNMFANCSALTSLNLSWGGNTKNVKNFAWMFANDNKLQTIDGIGEWDVSNATDMTNMFSGDSSLKSMDLSNWKTSKVTDMNHMFANCSALTSLNLSWGGNTKNVKNFAWMFANDNNLQTIDGIGEWNVSNATDISHMFACINLDSNSSTNYEYNFAQPQYCGSLTSLDLSNWDTGKVTDMEAVFWGQKLLTTVGNFSNWDTGNVTNMWDLFAGCEKLQFDNTALANLAKWNTSNVTNMRALFANMEKQKDLSCVQNWDTHKVQDMSYMFFQDADLKNVGNLTTRGNVWNTSQVGTLPDSLQNYGMSNMFAGCTSLPEIKGINTWNVSNVKKMRYMFYNTGSLKSLDLSGWHTSKLQMADQMFFGSGVTNLNLNGWDFSNLKLHADNGMIDNDQNNTIRGSEYMFGNLLQPCTINMTGITLPSQQKETFDVIDFFGADDRPLVVFSPQLLNLNKESWNFTNKSLLPVGIWNLFNKENAKGRQNSNYLTYYRNDDPNKTPIAYQKLNFIFKDKQAQKAQTMALMSLMALPTGQASVSQSPDFDEYLKQVTTVDQIKQLLGPDLAKLWDWKADTKNGSLTKIPGAQPIDQVCAKVGLTFIDGNATQTYTRTIIAKYSDDKPNETLATQTATFSDPYIDNDGNKVWGKHTSWTEFIAPTKAGYDANPASITGVDKPTKDDTAYIMYTKKAVTPDKPVTPPDDNPDQPVTPPDQPDKPSQPVTPSDKSETPSNQPNKAHDDNQSEPSTPASNGKYEKQKGYERNSGIHGEKVSRNKRHLTGVKGQPFGLKHKAAAQNTSTKSNGKATQTKLPQTDAKDNKALSLLGLSLAGITVLLGTIVERKHR